MESGFFYFYFFYIEKSCRAEYSEQKYRCGDFLEHSWSCNGQNISLDSKASGVESGIEPYKECELVTSCLNKAL